ncbi:class I SAM-dependent methyltransferase [Pseudonocardia eucalypti]|uniref:Class I SAM-dependent methyltransferase n=1 Tax=Pseudonocardia eucalypti TaxID=648755 RepID=A0ABP9QFY5_9PSEU|nr:2-polyprenyl-3-methyl-5-hydroxy-6-metoxy-1,4-benzoquinol methylase [Pseudonocardia eucalypti]
MSQMSELDSQNVFSALYQGDLDALNHSEWAREAGITFDFLPWDIGGPQPALTELEQSGQIRSEILDIGCGGGDNALFLAASGYQVVGVDIASPAVDRARAQARQRRLDAEFVAADATALTGYEGRFATVVDCTFSHGLTEQQRAAYLVAVHKACQPSALLHMICLSDSTPLKYPYGISKDYIHELFAETPGWVIRNLELVPFTTAFTRRYIEEQAASAVGDASDRAELRYDERDRLLAPAWMASVERL